MTELLRDSKQDIDPADDRGEAPSLMEPLILAGDSPHRSGLSDLALELASASSGFRRSLPAGIVPPLANLVREMNCYYSNLIEGHSTHPIDIERALKNDYSDDIEKRNLQGEAKAHIEVQRRIDRGEFRGRATTAEAICEIHFHFSELLPPEMLHVSDPLTSRTLKVVPGELRRDDVKVGRHLAISPGAVPRFLKRFESVYGSLGRSEKILTAAAAHHRLLWIHPFVDGNGRVARLMSHAVLLETLDTAAIWSVARGLARNVNAYKMHLMSCDQPRRNDLDGRGILSEESLAEFTRFFLETCLDQVRFMESLVQPERLRDRILIWAEEEFRAGELPTQAGQILEAVLFRGELPRGDVPALLGITDRQSRRVVSALIERGVLTSDSSRSSLRISFPAALAARWMPGLFPEQTAIDQHKLVVQNAHATFRERMPHVFQLKDEQADQNHPDSYFRDFEASLHKWKSKLDAFLKLENVFSRLDDEAWCYFKREASRHLISRERGRGRGWQRLFDVISEAYGYAFLQSIGCIDIHFIKSAVGLTTVLSARYESRQVFCVVKTVNISNDEAEKRRRIQSGETVSSRGLVQLGEVFMKKLSDTLTGSVHQLEAQDPQCSARRIIFTVLHFDDWVGDAQPAYFREIDAHLLKNPVADAELVFYLPSNLFGRTFTMKSAKVETEQTLSPSSTPNV